MVNRKTISFFLAFTLLTASVFAQQEDKKPKSKKKPVKVAAPAPLAPDLSMGNRKVVRLSQKDVAEIVLRQGPASKETNLQYIQNRLAPAQVLSNYDWNLNVNSGYLLNKTQSFSPLMPTNSKYETYQTDITLQKPIATTGTILGVEAHRLSQRADVIPGSTTQTILANQTQDIYGLTFEQPLLANFFGQADRASVRAAYTTYDANEVLRANALEDLTLDTIRQFWDTYVAQENFKEALASRDRYKKLLDSVRRKTSLGYSVPGDLSQTEAQYEAQEQKVKTSSLDYLARLEKLLTSLKMDSNTEIEFVVTEALPPIPKVAPVNPENLRIVRSQKLKVEAATDELTASRSKRFPTVNFVGKVYTSGADETSEGSYAAAASGSHPEYYLGLRVAYKFGSDFQTEDIINKKATKELEETRLARETAEVHDNLAQAERKVQATYAVAQSAQRQKEYFDRAVQELNRTYAQGRTDIKTLTDVMNSYFTAEIQLSRSVGDYQIALNELAASRDELIAEVQEVK